jgi:hypothetical protein
MSAAVRGCGFGSAPFAAPRSDSAALSAEISDIDADTGSGCRCPGHQAGALGMAFRPRAAHIVPFRPVGVERAPEGSPELAKGSHEIPPHDRFPLAVPRRGFLYAQCGRDFEGAALP